MNVRVIINVRHEKASSLEYQLAYLGDLLLTVT